MSSTTKKKNIFNKFVDLLSGKPEEEDREMAKEAVSEGEFAPRNSEPKDLQFVRNFVRSGGKFLYCEEDSEAYRYIAMIMQESGLQQVFCEDENLISVLQKSQAPVEQKNFLDADAFCSGCEFLVSFNGGIMITDRQTRGKTLDELPETFITIARTSQITENLRSGLTGIRVKYAGDLPSRITTIKGPVKLDNIEDTQPGKVCQKDIYLLLLEDQL